MKKKNTVPASTEALVKSITDKKNVRAKRILNKIMQKKVAERLNKVISEIGD